MVINLFHEPKLPLFFRTKLMDGKNEWMVGQIVFGGSPCNCTH